MSRRPIRRGKNATETLTIVDPDGKVANFVEAARSQSPGRTLPPEIQRQVDANAATREHRRRVLADLRSNYATWGASKAELAELFENEAGVLRAEVEQAKREARGRR